MDREVQVGRGNPFCHAVNCKRRPNPKGGIIVALNPIEPHLVAARWGFLTVRALLFLVVGQSSLQSLHQWDCGHEGGLYLVALGSQRRRY